MMKSSALLLRQRAVIVTGSRTPFAKAFGKYKYVDTVGLAGAAVAGLLARTKIDPMELDHVVWGNVVTQGNAPNCARELILDLGLPTKIVAHNTSMACASGLNALIESQLLIEGGHADVMIAGGSDSVSNSELPLPRAVMYGLNAMEKEGFGGFVREAGENPRDWIPDNTARGDRITNKPMGYYGDIIAEIHGVSREDQEALALASHRNAAAAEARGCFEGEIAPFTPHGRDGAAGKEAMTHDDVMQRDTDKMKAKMPSLKPCFRPAPEGTITAATSSALTDGGSAVLIMSEEKARKLGYPTDISMRSFAFTAIDPYPNLLMAPVLGWGPALKKAGLTVDDIDLFEVHEAFAAQVLATLKKLQDAEFIGTHTGRYEAVLSKPLDMSKLNVNGSSLAFGHPFAATGGRLVTSLSHELRRSGKQYGLISVCAAGGEGCVVILENANATTKK